MSNDKHNINEQEFVAQINEALDASVDRIDAETCQKINSARQRALAQQKPNPFLASNWGKAIFATAVSIFVAVLVVKTQIQTSFEEVDLEDMELMAAKDTLDMYEELEFYTWLVDEDVTT